MKTLNSTKVRARVVAALPAALRRKTIPRSGASTAAPALVGPVAVAPAPATAAVPPGTGSASAGPAVAAPPDPPAAAPPADEEKTKWWSRLWKSAAVVAFVAGTMATTSKTVTDGVFSFVGGIFHSKSASAPKPSSDPAKPLAFDVLVNYDADNDLALPAPLTQGRNYAALLTGDFAAPGAGDALGSFLAATSGAAVGTLPLTLTITDISPGPISVIDIRLKPDPPTPNMTGTRIPIPHAGGGGVDSYHFTVNLDSPTPDLVGASGQASFSSGFHLDLTPGSNSAVEIQFNGTRYSYAWTLLVSYVDKTGARTTQEVKNPDGGLFRLTGAASSYQVKFVSNYPEAGYHLAP